MDSDLVGELKAKKALIARRSDGPDESAPAARQTIEVWRKGDERETAEEVGPEEVVVRWWCCALETATRSQVTLPNLDK